MSEPNSPVTLDGALKEASEAIAALKRTKPKNDIQARARAAELMRLQRLELDCMRQMADAAARQRIAGNGHANSALIVADLLSEGAVTALAKAIAPFVKTVVGEALAPLKQRLAELEARPGLKYEGVWDEQKVYSTGDFCTHGGSLWHCWDTNRGVRPGSSDAWQLAVQRGKDGKDAKGRR